MNKIIIQLPVNRDYAGRLEIQNAAGKRIAGPFPVSGRADDGRALANKNPARNPLLPFGDTPLGEYKVVKIISSGQGTSYSSDEFGSTGIVLLQPKQGDAALADANGRFGFFIQGGARSRSRLLRPTQDGSLRLSDGDQRRFIGALRKLGEINCQCLVITTAKAGGKVAIASSPAAARTSRNKSSSSSSLLLASSVVASLVTGTIRQALLRTTLHGAGASLASSGLVLVAADHASAQPAGGDYNPVGGGAMDQLNTVEHNSQDATHASTDEEAHDKASQGIDTSSSAAPPAVDLHDKEGIVNPDAASGDSHPASDAGLAPGSPIFSQPDASPAPVVTPPSISVPTQPIQPTPQTETQPDVTPTQPDVTPTQPDVTPTQPDVTPTQPETPPVTPAEPSSTPAETVAPVPETATPENQQGQQVQENGIVNPGTVSGVLPAAAAAAVAGLAPGTPIFSQADLNPDSRTATAADYATSKAIPVVNGIYGTQQCAAFVTAALTNSGITLDKNVGDYRTDGHGYAKNLGPVLTNAGFTPVYEFDGSSNLNMSGFTPQKGDVVVVQSPDASNPAGHTAIFNGTDWVSDFVQSTQRIYHADDGSGGIWPGPSFRTNHPALQIYRLPAPPQK